MFARVILNVKAVSLPNKFKAVLAFKMSDVASSSWVSETLQNESTKKYFIEHTTYRSNHMAHGIIALSKLGASETRIKQFIDWYRKKCEPPDFANHQGENPDTDPADDQELEQLRGKRTNYYAIYNNYKAKLAEMDSLERFVQIEFPKLSRGMSCSALHGLIQLGYGYSIGSPTIVGEGMAYLCYSFKPLTFDETKPENDIVDCFGRGSSDIIEVLNEIRSDTKLRKLMLDGVDDFARSSWKSSRFQYRMAALMKAGDQIMNYANKVNIPVVADQSSFDQVDTIQVADWLLHQAIAVYTFADKKNDFFLLHGVTGAWSLRQVIPALKHADAMDAVRTFTCVLLAAYMVQDTPELVPNQPKKCDEECLWKEIIEESLSRDRDEHIFKLIQVVNEVWRENKNTEYGGLCVEAAQSCLSNDLYFMTVAET